MQQYLALARHTASGADASLSVAMRRLRMKRGHGIQEMLMAVACVDIQSVRHRSLVGSPPRRRGYTALVSHVDNFIYIFAVILYEGSLRSTFCAGRCSCAKNAH